MGAGICSGPCCYSTKTRKSVKARSTTLLCSVIRTSGSLLSLHHCSNDWGAAADYAELLLVIEVWLQQKKPTQSIFTTGNLPMYEQLIMRLKQELLSCRVKRDLGGTPADIVLLCHHCRCGFLFSNDEQSTRKPCQLYGASCAHDLVMCSYALICGFSCAFPRSSFCIRHIFLVVSV